MSYFSFDGCLRLFIYSIRLLGRGRWSARLNLGPRGSTGRGGILCEQFLADMGIRNYLPHRMGKTESADCIYYLRATDTADHTIFALRRGTQNGGGHCSVRSWPGIARGATMRACVCYWRTLELLLHCCCFLARPRHIAWRETHKLRKWDLSSSYTCPIRGTCTLTLSFHSLWLLSTQWVDCVKKYFNINYIVVFSYNRFRM